MITLVFKINRHSPCKISHSYHYSCSSGQKKRLDSRHVKNIFVWPNSLSKLFAEWIQWCENSKLRHIFSSFHKKRDFFVTESLFHVLHVETVKKWTDRFTTKEKKLVKNFIHIKSFCFAVQVIFLIHRADGS